MIYFPLGSFPLGSFRWTDPYQTQAQHLVLQAPLFNLIAEVFQCCPFRGGDDLWTFVIRNYASKQPIFEAQAPTQHTALRRAEVALGAFVSGQKSDKDCSIPDSKPLKWGSYATYQGLFLHLSKNHNPSEGDEPWRLVMYDHMKMKTLYEGSAPSKNEGMRRAETALKLFVLGRDAKEET